MAVSRTDRAEQDGGAALPERSGERSSEQLPHPSTAIAVTLFEDRAEVVRVASVSAAAGAHWIAIGGISPFIDERTIQARIRAASADSGPSGPRVTAARVRWRAHREAALGRAEIDALEREEREAAQRVAAAELARDRAARREAQAGQLLGRWARALGAVPKGASGPDGMDSWHRALAALDGATREALRGSTEARAARARAEDERQRAALRLREGLLAKPRYEAVIEVELRAPAAQPVEIELVYRVACAMFRPEHLARLTGATAVGAAGAERPAVELVTWATAWQATGEAWHNVTARFSTARPSRSAEAPLLADDVLQTRRRTDADRRRVVVEAREQVIAAAGLDRGTRSVDEMPGVDDGGEPLVFEAAEPVSIPSDGRPLRVEVARRKLPAEVELVLLPEAHPAAHVRATMALSDAGGAAPRPLLAGPVRVARGGSLIGRASIGFVGAGEPFELGFGVDDAVRVRRAVEEEHDSSMITGTRKIRRVVKLFLSNLSSEAKRILVTERIPVSEVEEVGVTLADAPGWKVDERDGFLRGRVELAPNGMATMSFCYEIRASSGAVLPF